MKLNDLAFKNDIVFLENTSFKAQQQLNKMFSFKKIANLTLQREYDFKSVIQT